MDSQDEDFQAPTPEPGLERLPHLPAALERWFRNTPAILHSIDGRGRQIEVSDAWLDKFGYSREEALGRRSIEFLTADSADYAISEVMPEFYRTGRCENIEYQMVCKDGRALDVLLSGVLDHSDPNCGPCSLAVITDVTALRAAERKLAESEALYKGLIESQTELVSLARPDGELCFVNHAYAHNYNRQPHELIGTNLLDYVPMDCRRSVLEQLEQVCASTLSIETENQVVVPDGQTRWIGWTNRAIRDAQGRVTVIHSVGRDVERRVVAEQRMKESEARFRLLAENSSDIVILVRMNGRRLYVSPACQKLLGWSPEEMLEMTAQEMVHPDDRPILRSAFADAGSDNLTLTYRLRRRDGTFIWVEAARQRVEIAGEPSARLIVIRDIEQRMEAERRLRESEASYRRLADHSSDMVFELDRDLVRRYVSPATRDVLGFEPAELIGLKPLEKCHPDDAERVAAAFAALLSGEVESQHVIHRKQHRDGRWIWVESRFKALRDTATGEISGVTGAIRDITRLKSIEDQLGEANRRLEILAAQDSLTGLANRRAFDAALAQEHLRAYREMTPLGLILIDVDSFKSFNDSFGHPAGDECLKDVAGAIAGAFRRPGDLAARYGGEEFVVLLPNTDEAGAAEVAERIRLAVRGLGLQRDAATEDVVTVSAGVCAAAPRATNPVELLVGADRALYRAKDRGRDQVVNASWLRKSAKAAAGEAELVAGG